MWLVAIKMLVGDTGKYVGMIFGVTFAALLMVQQGGIFWGLMNRTAGFIDDTNQPDIWVADPKVQYVDDLKPIQDTMLLRVRGVEGVEWAMPMYKGLLKARLTNGNFQNCIVVGVDDATLIGGPPRMLKGSIDALRQSEGIIVDEVGANDKLARIGPDGQSIPLQVGDTLELNDRRAVVVGICRAARSFQSQPLIYTTYSRATTFAPRERRLMSFVLVKAKPGMDIKDLSGKITTATGLSAYPQEEFWWMTILYYMKYTGIPINFAISVLLGFIVGAAICGQTFYQFTLDNLKQFGALKAMGAGNLRLLGMIILQAAIVAVVGYGLGVGLATALMFRASTGEIELAFKLTYVHLVGTAIAVMLITVIAAILSLIKVMRLEPAIVFKG